MLTILTSRPGELVTRDELRRELWDQGTFVDFDACLNYCARRIRSALGDCADSPAYLQTVPRRGYRFIAVVQSGSPAPVGRPIGWLAVPAHPRLAAAALSLGLLGGFIVGHAAEAAPWHDQVVSWIHGHVGTLPGICQRP